MIFNLIAATYAVLGDTKQFRNLVEAYLYILLYIFIMINTIIIINACNVFQFAVHLSFITCHFISVPVVIETPLKFYRHV